MTAFLRTMRSEWIKLRRQPVLLLHLVLPLAAIGIFLGYFACTPYAQAAKVVSYFQALAAAFPTFIGIVCSMSVDQEAAAGHFQHLLTQPSRVMPLAGKLAGLLVPGFASTMLAAAGFGAGFIFLLREPVLDLGFYFQSGFMLFGCCLFLYALHVFVSLRFGKVASIGLGIAESLTGALLLTGLGDGIWGYFPCAWASRMVTLWAHGNLTEAMVPDPHLATAILCCAVGTAAILILLGCWFRRWEGKTSFD